MYFTLTNTLGTVRQWQKLFLWQALQYDQSSLWCPFQVRTEGAEYPKYTPDFVKLAESYGAKGIRVFNKTEESQQQLKRAKKNTKVPTLIEFIIDPEEMVYPMIKPGGTLEDYDHGLLGGGRPMADKGMKKRWISLYVENQVGVLSKISGLFSGKSLQSWTA